MQSYLSLLSLLLVLAFVSAGHAPGTVCLTRFGPAVGHNRQLPTRTSTVTVTRHQKETPANHWKRVEQVSSANGACATAIATSVSTVYTGTWNHNATMTILPHATLRRRFAPHAGGVRFYAGQPLDHMMDNANHVECLVMKTTIHIASSASGDLSTSFSSTAATSSSTSAASSLYSSASSSQIRRSTACTPFTRTSVTTQDIRCAPSNLIATIEPGRAINGVDGWNPALVSLQSASDCCQLCMDIDGCSSVLAAVGARNCVLNFGNTRCGLAEIARQDPDPDATIGNVVVQSGCGTIEFTTES